MSRIIAFILGLFGTAATAAEPAECASSPCRRLRLGRPRVLWQHHGEDTQHGSPRLRGDTIHPGIRDRADLLTGIPVKDVEAMREALKKADNKASEIVVFPDAPHAFFADYRPSYRKEAAEDGWKRLLEWFKKNGVA